MAGVEAVGHISYLPMATGGPSASYRLPDKPLPDDVPSPFANFQLVTPGYFRAMGIPLIRGRLLDHTDREEAPLVGLINETMARNAFGNEDVVGRQINMFGGGALFTVVGVVGDSRQRRPNEEPRPEAFFSFDQQNWTNSLFLTVRTTADPSSAITAIRQAVWDIDGNIPISDVRTMQDVISTATADARFFTVLIAAFGALALLLGAVGVYGVLSYVVSQRTHEIGIRIALGADGGRVLRSAMAKGLSPVALGIAVGLFGAFAATRLLSGLLFGVSATDPVTFAVVPIVLLTVAAFASYLPARKAAMVDPMVSLSME